MSVSPTIRAVVFTGGPELADQVMDFVNRLEQDPGIELAAIFSESPTRGMRGAALDLWRRRGVLAIPLAIQAACRAAWRRAMSPRRSRRRRRLLEQLGARTHYVTDLHDSAVLSRVRTIEPDVGLVYGGPIIKAKLFEIPRLGCVGIHHGKLPEYRGKKTTFWAMYDGEDEAGVAIQRIGPTLDGGDVLLQARVPIGKRPLPVVVNDLECVGIDLYLRAIHALRDGTADFTPQSGARSRIYKDPQVSDILRFWCRYLVRLAR